MTVSEAISRFKLYYNQKTGVEAPGFLDSEIKQILQDSQMDLIGDKSFGENFQGPSFESNQRRVSELKDFVINSSLTPTASADYMDYYCTLPTGETGFMYYVRSKSKVDRFDHPQAMGAYYKNVFIKHDWADRFEDYGKRSHFIEPRVTIDDDKLYIKVDSFTMSVNKVDLTYIRKPADINNMGSTGTIDMPDGMHDDLIQTAVRKAVASGTPTEGKYEVQSIEEKKTTD
jgi:hypothetical protein